MNLSLLSLTNREIRNQFLSLSLFLVILGLSVTGFAIFELTKEIRLRVRSVILNSAGDAEKGGNEFTLQKQLDSYDRELEEIYGFKLNIMVTIRGKTLAQIGQSESGLFHFPLNFTDNTDGGTSIGANGLIIVDRLVVKSLIVMAFILFLTFIIVWKSRQSLENSVRKIIVAIEKTVELVKFVSLYMEPPDSDALNISNIEIAECRVLVDSVGTLTRNIKELERDLSEIQTKAGGKAVARQIAHDIRSPIGALMTAFKTLQLDNSDERVSVANHALARIAMIAESALSNTSPSQLTFDLNSSIAEMIKEKTTTFTSSLAIRSDVDATQTLLVRGSRVLFQRAFSNLLNNAEEASDSKSAIIIRVRKENQIAVVEIADKGCGIKPEILKLLGKEEISYNQAGHQGHGVGVKSAFETITSFGGKLSYESQVASGTTVTLELICI